MVQVADRFARTIAKVFILTLAQQIADWIAGGFQGNPSFLNDPARFAVNITNQTIGEFIYNDPSLSFLCKPFQLQIKLSLAIQHRKFYQTVNCTLTGVVNNVTNAIMDPYNAFKNGDFIGGGGWDSFLVMTTDPNATPEGAFLTMSSELDARIQNKQGALTKELSQGMGSLSFKKCTETSYAVTKTPDGITERQEVAGSQREYTGNPFYDQSTTTTSYTSAGDNQVNNWNSLWDTSYTYEGTDKVTDCKTTTPGALIASNLFSSSQSGQRMGEFQAVVGDAMDIIIGGVSTLVVSTALAKIREAFSGSTQNYASIDQITADLQAQQAQQAAYNATYNSGGSLGGGTISGGSIYTDSLYTQRNSAIEAINNQIGYETVYQTTQNHILNYLNNIRTLFVQLQGCYNTNSGAGDGQNGLRASAIQSAVLNAIDGQINPSTGSYLFALNVNVINNHIASSTANGSNLSARLTAVQNATTATQISSQLSGLGNAPFHSSTEAVSTSNADSIYAWATTGVIGNYNNQNVCSATIPAYTGSE